LTFSYLFNRKVTLPVDDDSLEKQLRDIILTFTGKSHEFGPDAFWMEPEKKELSEDILPFVSSLVGKQVRAKASKLGLYATGGGFSAVADTPKSEAHVGTLVVVLPTNFTGGDLVVKNKDKEETLDWAEKLSSSRDPTNSLVIQWAFIDADMEYSIKPVDSGLQLVLSYNIVVPKPWIESSLATLNTPTSLAHNLQQCLSNPEFLSDGGKLAFALTKAYPITPLRGSAGRDFFKNEFHQQLRGADALFYSVATMLGLKIEMCIVYDLYGHKTGDLEKVINKYHYHEKEPDSDILPRGDLSALFDTSLLLTSQETSFFLDGLCRDDQLTILEMIIEACKANVELDVIWARRPSRGTSTATGAHTFHMEDW
jgi:hypothetical protein